MKVLFVGNFQVNDYGTQALTFPLIEKLNTYFDKVEYTFLITEKNKEGDEAIAKKYGFKLKIYRYPRFFLSNITLKEYDLIIDADGLEFNGKQSLFKRWFHFFATNYIHNKAIEDKVPYIKFTKSYGEFPHAIHKYFVERQLNKLPFVMIRDDAETGLNLKVKAHPFPDISFLMKARDENWAKEYLKNLGIDLNKKLIGITPSKVLIDKENNRGEEYFYALCRQIEGSMSENSQVILIPHSLDDFNLCNKIYNKIHNKNLFFMQDTNLEYSDVKAIIGQLDYHLTSRYHSLTSALSQDIPTEAISWHNKYNNAINMYKKDGVDKIKERAKASVKLIANYYYGVKDGHIELNQR